MHICLLYPGYPPESHAGGIGTYVFEAVKALSQAGQRITVISRSDSLRDSKEHPASNVFIYRLGEESSNPSLLFRTSNHENHYQRVYNTVEKIHAVNPIDVIESCDWGAEGVGLLGTPFAQKLIVRCHTPSFISEQFNLRNGSYLSDAIKNKEKKLLTKAQYVISPSHYLATMIIKILPTRRPIEFEPYLIDTKQILMKQDYSFRDNFSILTVGRIEERKGQDIITKAVETLNRQGVPIHFHAFGQDTLSSTNTSLSQMFLEMVDDSTQKRVAFNTALPRQDILNIYKDYDVYVAASRFDNFPFTVLESMAAGLPVIGNSIAGGIPEQISDGHNGMLFNGTATDLADKITALFADEELRYSLGTNAMRHVKEIHNPKLVTDKMLRHYRSLCTTSNI